MFCPGCGVFNNDGSLYCLRCGARLPQCAYRDDHTQYGNISNRNRKKKLRDISVVVFVLALIGVMIFYGLHNIPDWEEYNEDEGYELSFNCYTENYSTCFKGNDFTVISDGSDRVCIVLEHSEYSDYQWVLYDKDHAIYESDIDEDPVYYTGTVLAETGTNVIVFDLIPGDYRLEVYCSKGIDNGTYKLNILTDGKVTRDFEWEFDDVDYSMSITFDYSQYYRFKTLNPELRSVIAYDQCVRYAVEDPVTRMLASNLKEVYVGDIYNDQKFADYILAFVQICFDYPNNGYDGDMSLYGMNEYYAYPVETIFRCQGDCEDTSILAAVLYDLLGYRSAIGIVPKHAIVGVEIPDYVIPSNIPGACSLTYLEVDGTMYYAGETTLDRALPVGVCPHLKGEKMNSCFGGSHTFYPITSS